ncbi:MAG: glycosyltransferase family 4 protein [Nitrososphaerota archaeon]
MMNVLIVHPSLNAHGGSERVCLTIIEALKERDYNVTLGAFEKTNWESLKEFFGDVKKPDVEVVHRRFFGTSAYEELLNFHFFLLRMTKKYDLVIISCASPWFYCPTEGRAIIYLNLVPINYLHGFKHAYLVPYISMQKILLKRQRKKIVLTNSLFSSKIIENMYSFKPEVVYPPVDIENFYPAPKENMIVSVGRFDPYKNYEILIRASSQFRDGRSLIIGSIYGRASARYFNKLKNLINRLKVSDKVRLIVNCPSAELKRILSKAKIYIHCARFEYFGMSIIEAMACGCVPIVYGGGGAYIDVIDRGKYGLSFNNINELIDNVNLLLEDNSLFKRFSKKAIKRAHFFNKQGFKESFLKIVDKVYLL